MPRDTTCNCVYVESDSETYEQIPDIKPQDDLSVFHVLGHEIFVGIDIIHNEAANFLKAKGYYDLPVAATMTDTEMAVVYLAHALGNSEDVRLHCKRANQSWFYLHNPRQSGIRFLKRFHSYFASYLFLANAMDCEEKFLHGLEALHQHTVDQLNIIKNEDGTWGDRENYFHKAILRNL